MVTATSPFRVSPDYFKVVGFVVSKAHLIVKLKSMIEKLSSLKDKIRAGDRSDLRKREKASKQRKKE